MKTLDHQSVAGVEKASETRKVKLSGRLGSASPTVPPTGLQGALGAEGSDS